MDVKQINSAIMLGTWTDIELRSMIDAVQWNRSQLAIGSPKAECAR
jgi:hypothetical protein